MNALERTLIEKAGYDNGWEIVVESVPEQVVLASALHRANATIREDSGCGRWLMSLPAGSLRVELSKAEADYYAGEGHFRVSNDRELGHLLRYAARLARSLPNQPEVRYLAAVEKELAATIANTEVERLVRQRVGQDIYRDSLIDYWGGACAVTGIAIPALLRASHAIPWSECQSDADRLNVYNGFLLAAHLDALFDRHLLSFDNSGTVLYSPTITPEIRTALGLSETLMLRRISPEHLPFLEIHRAAFLHAH
jgi:hypothetical protein